MVIIEDPASKAFRITQLAKHIISNAQVAGDVKEFGVANQLLHIAEALMRDASLTHKVRLSLAALLIGAHQRFWHMRDQDNVDLLSRGPAGFWKH